MIRHMASVKLGDSGIFFTTKNTNDPKKFHGISNASQQSQPLPMKFFRGVSCFSLFKKNSSVSQLHCRNTNWQFFFMMLFLACNVFSAQWTVFVSVPPQMEAVQKIAGGNVQLEVLVPPGMNPENYTLSAKRISSLSRADAVFLIGVEFEKVLRSRLDGTLKAGVLIDTREGMTLRKMEEHDHGGHSHYGWDPHVWLNPANMLVYARHVEQALSRLDPERRELYQQRCEGYCRELQNLKQQLDEMLRKYSGHRVLVVHPAFGYLLDLYGIGQLALEQEGKEPGARRLSQLLRTAKSENHRVIFTQPQFSDKSARVLMQNLKGSIVSLDPLPEQYSEGMLKLAQALLQGLQQP